MTVEDAAPQFDERAVELIKASLPAEIDQRRIDLLPLILSEWSVHILPEHLSREGRATVRTRYDRVKKVGNCATLLRQALEAIDQRGRSWIVREIAREEGSTFFTVSREKFTDMRERLHQEHDFLKKLTAATMRRLKQEDDFLRKLTAATLRLSEEDERSRGQPRNIRAYLVMMDIAAIFEWLTDRKATREVDRSNKKETGAFWHFAAAVWPHVFGRGSYGLSSAMKNWGTGHSRFGEESQLIRNIAMRHPEWGVLDTTSQ
jgi:hypothetical protein